MLVGLVSLLIGDYHFFGRKIAGLRRAVIGVSLLIQAPVAITLGSILLGDAPAGSINNAPIEYADNRLAALCGEWIFLGIILSTVLYLLLSAPSVDEEKEEAQI